MKPNFEFEPDDIRDELKSIPSIKHLPRKNSPARPKTGKKAAPAVASSTHTNDFYRQQDDSVDSFSFTYRASRYESGWLLKALGDFYENQWIGDVLRLARGGKEASVYLCTGGPAAHNEPLLAAKVYRPRMFRALRKDHLYREGRPDLDENGNTVIDDGMLHAMAKRSSYGQELLHTSWIEHEYHTLEVLQQAGADTPVPYTRGNNSILMQYVGDENGPAPSLSEVDLDSAEANIVYQRVIHNLKLMLAHNLIHGDLSAYNILYWEGKITLIDFPQAINPAENQNAWRIFERDVVRVCEYFSRQGVRCEGRSMAKRLWQSFHLRTAPEPDPYYLDAENSADRRYWEKAKKG